eukprot:767646-Hanusia_phi.AAC.4
MDAAYTAAILSLAGMNVVQITKAEKVPEAIALPACKKCPQFHSWLTGSRFDQIAAHGLEVGPDILLTLLFHFIEVLQIETAPPKLLTKDQLKFYECVMKKEAIVDIKKLKQARRTRRMRRSRVRGSRSVAADGSYGFKWGKDTSDARTQITQFSLHKRVDVDSEIQHMEFLADAKSDFRLELLEHLLECLGDQGSIVVYSSFEKTHLKVQFSAPASSPPTPTSLATPGRSTLSCSHLFQAFAQKFPSHSQRVDHRAGLILACNSQSQIEDVIARLFDLEKATRAVPPAPIHPFLVLSGDQGDDHAPQLQG